MNVKQTTLESVAARDLADKMAFIAANMVKTLKAGEEANNLADASLYQYLTAFEAQIANMHGAICGQLANLRVKNFTNQESK